MEIIFSHESLQDLHFWKQTGNVKIQNRIMQLLESIKKILMKVLVNLKL
jgi:Txe/YoeB family toxin of Txe-Axe toxin-antitoxin module